MVRQHVLLGLGLRKQNFRNRALRYMMDKLIKGSGSTTMRLMVMPYSRPTKGSGHETMRPAVEPPSNSRQRAPLKFNY